MARMPLVLSFCVLALFVDAARADPCRPRVVQTQALVPVTQITQIVVPLFNYHYVGDQYDQRRRIEVELTDEQLDAIANRVYDKIKGTIKPPPGPPPGPPPVPPGPPPEPDPNVEPPDPPAKPNSKVPTKDTPIDRAAISVLAAKCASCHSGNGAKGGLQMFDGGGKPASTLPRWAIWDMSDRKDDRRMPPPPRAALSKDELAVLRAWARSK